MLRGTTRALFGSVAVTTLALAGTSAAQAPEQNQAAMAQPSPASSGPPAKLEEVIVTATKRAENIQDVPISVQAIGGAKVRQLNLSSLSDIGKVVPSFTFLDNYTPRTQGSLIRGIGTYTTSDAIEPSVGVVVDGVALGRQGMAFIDPFDVSQIEVLEGPQGTLFGKNASAGVVSITTQAPSLTPELSARALFGNRDEQQYGLSVAGALAPNLATRLTLYYNTRGGYVDDVYLNKEVNNLNNYGGRGKIRFESGDADVTIIADYNRYYANCCAWVAISDGGPGTYRTLLTAAGLTASETNFSEAANVLPESRSNSGGVSVTAHLRRGTEDFTSITALRAWQTLEVADADQLPIDLVDSFERSRQYQLSEELRASNNDSSTWAHTFGLYYFHYLIKDNVLSLFPASGGLFGPLGTVQARTYSDLTYDNGAAFGEVTHTFPDQETKLRVGARITVENVATDISRADNIEFVPGFGPYALRDNNLNVGETFVVALQHRFTPGIMAYAQVSRGFKGAAYDLPGPTDPEPADLVSRRVSPEIAMNYEIGVRSQFFDHTLTLNATAFYETFDNYQATTYDAAANAFRLENVGSLLSRGVEAQFDWRPTRAFTFGGSILFLDARYASFKAGQCQYTFYTEGLCTETAPGSYIIDLSGKRIFSAPEWSFNLNARYDWRNLPWPFDVYILGNYSYRSATVSEPSIDPVNYLQSYGLFDARVGITTRDGRYELSLYGKNLTNQTYFQAHFFAPLFGGLADGNNATDAFQGLPRSYGVELVARF